ncbi:MAG: hypothetical protein HKP61_02265 [Dactylosporangium sp.]|nr:hypothetical protein [Dactylosporangium sp.]NNJ59786.1 hypothetical protein [Dactylosporangium sp.]
MKRHATDLVSLVFAIILLSVVALWFLGDVAHLRLPRAGWGVAAALIFFGALGLLHSWRKGRRDDQPPQT